MNPRMELEEVIQNECFAYFGEDHELSPQIYRSILNWMERNELVFYQP